MKRRNEVVKKEKISDAEKQFNSFYKKLFKKHGITNNEEINLILPLFKETFIEGYKCAVKRIDDFDMIDEDGEK
jgi:hypothetical protein